MNHHAQNLHDRIDSGTAVVGIIGLGYVGLPLALAFAEKRMRVVGFDVDPKKIEAISRGECYIKHLDGRRLSAAIDGGSFSATADFARLGETDAILVCVPTPLTPQREPDMSYVAGTAREIAARLRPGQLVVLESTTYPGTTDELVRGLLEERGLRSGEDFFLAFSPEREDPGNPDYGTTTIPKVVGGVDPTSGDLAEALYGKAVARVVRVSSARTAEASKLTENIFRAVNIALVNELKVTYDAMGIDIWEVLDAAETKPFGFMRFNPGPGWGGHCVTGDQWLRVRGRGLSGVYRAKELFALLRADCPTVVGQQGTYIEPEGLEALALDATSGDVGWFPVETVFGGAYEGPCVEVTTEDRRRLTVTAGHPMLVLRGESFATVSAAELRAGDELPVVSDLGGPAADPVVDLVAVVPASERTRVWVRVKDQPWAAHAAALKRRYGWTIRDSIRSDALRLDRFLEVEAEIGVERSELRLLTGMGSARREWPSTLRVTPDVCRLIGYFLAEGCISTDGGAKRVRFTFNRSEAEYLNDVAQILSRNGFVATVYQDKTWHSTTLKVSSLLLAWLLGSHWRCGRRSQEMRGPDLVFGLSVEHKRELLKGLLRGDGDVWVRSGRSSYRKNGRLYSHQNATAVVGFFSSSPVLLEQVVHLLQDLGFRPRFKAGSPQVRLQGTKTVSKLAQYFAGEKRVKLEAAGAARRRAVHSLCDAERLAPNLLTTKVLASTTSEVACDVYSLEVSGAQSFCTSSGIAVHNCIPLDPFYLSWKAREYGVAPKFIELAGEVNVEMPRYVVGKLQQALNQRGKPVKGCRVLILGLAYKKDIDDPRESPAFEVIRELLALGAEVRYHDPHIPRAPRMRSWPDLPAMESQPLTPETVAGCDAVVLVTDHSAVDYDLVEQNAALIVDTRGVFRRRVPHVTRA